MIFTIRAIQHFKIQKSLEPFTLCFSINHDTLIFIFEHNSRNSAYMISFCRKIIKTPAHEPVQQGEISPHVPIMTFLPLDFICYTLVITPTLPIAKRILNSSIHFKSRKNNSLCIAQHAPIDQNPFVRLFIEVTEVF